MVGNMLDVSINEVTFITREKDEKPLPRKKAYRPSNGSPYQNNPIPNKNESTLLL